MSVLCRYMQGLQGMSCTREFRVKRYTCLRSYPCHLPKHSKKNVEKKGNNEHSRAQVHRASATMSA